MPLKEAWMLPLGPREPPFILLQRPLRDTVWSDHMENDKREREWSQMSVDSAAKYSHMNEDQQKSHLAEFNPY